MLAALALVLLLAQPVDDELEHLAATGQWQALRGLVDGRLERDPNDEFALYWLGREQLEESWGLLDGDRVAQDIGRAVLQRAIEYLGAALAGGVQDSADWLLQARYTHWQLERVNVGVGDGDALISDLERAWRDDSRPMAAFLLGRAARLREDAEALRWFERAATAAPARSAYALDWSRELASAGDREGALAAWTTARRATDWDLEELLAVLLTALPAQVDAERRLAWLEDLAADPTLADDALLAWHRAHTLASLDRLAEAADAFARGTRGRTEAMDRAEASYLWGLGRPAEALELLFARARERQWACLDDAVEIADALAIERRFDEALAAYSTALSIEPRHERALWHRALASWHSGLDEQASAAWAELLEQFPGRSDIVNDAALAAWGVANYTLVRQRLELAVTWPGSRDAQENLAVLLLSEQPTDGARALQLLNGVLERDPERDRSLLYRYRARCLTFSGHP